MRYLLSFLALSLLPAFAIAQGDLFIISTDAQQERPLAFRDASTQFALVEPELNLPAGDFHFVPSDPSAWSVVGYLLGGVALGGVMHRDFEARELMMSQPWDPAKLDINVHLEDPNGGFVLYRTSH